jgi:hypothetical protein
MSEPSEEEVVEAIYGLAADQMKAGASGLEIESMLVEKGLDRGVAATVVENLTRMRSEAVRSAGRKNPSVANRWGDLRAQAACWS